MFRKKGDIMNYYDEIKNILVDNAIGRKIREYKSNQKDLESYYNVWKTFSRSTRWRRKG